LSDFHHGADPSSSLVSLTATEATRQQSLNYGCVVEDSAAAAATDSSTHAILHYVEKPETYVSTLINCGVYVFSKDIFPMLKEVFRKKQEAAAAMGGGPGQNGGDTEAMWIEKDILPALAGTGKARVYQTSKWWSQIKTAGAAIYANRHYLDLYRKVHPERLASGDGSEGGRPLILENVFVHRDAKVDSTAVVICQN
jgi:mannose-1-phosphate guanylyltransferase